MNELIAQSDQLAEAAKQFEQWRMTRNKKERIPAELVSLVPPLKKHYGTSQILRALRISYAQLQKYLQLPEASIASTTQASFVECQIPPVLSATPSQGITLSFNSKSGQPVTISGLNGGDLACILPALMGASL